MRLPIAGTGLILSLALAVSLPVFIGAASAQTMDPRVLEQLQSQLGAGQLQREPGGQPPQQSNAIQPTIPGQKIDTSEEQEVRRAEARRQLRDLYQPSEVELDYRRRLDDRQLRQFGYDFFQSAPPPSGV
ncbi:MAG: hypothetical protein ACRC1J_04400, partial [Sandaracinobacteroides sp.]